MTPYLVLRQLSAEISVTYVFAGARNLSGTISELSDSACQCQWDQRIRERHRDPGRLHDDRIVRIHGKRMRGGNPQSGQR